MALSFKLLKIPFQSNLQIQNRTNGSRDIRPTRATTYGKNAARVDFEVLRATSYTPNKCLLSLFGIK